MANKFLSILGTIGKDVLKGADYGAKAGIPIASQIDAIADAIKDVKGKSKTHDEALAVIADNIKELKTVVPDVVSSPKTALQSNRFKMSVIGVGVSVLVSWGLPAEIASQAMSSVFYIVSAYVLGDTLRPSTTKVPVTVPPTE